MKKAMKIVTEIGVGIFLLVISMFFYPHAAYSFLIPLSEILSAVGFNFKIVGGPSDIDPGAVVSAVFYLGCSCFISSFMYKWKKKALALTTFIGGIVSAFLVFGIVSSLLHF